MALQAVPVPRESAALRPLHKWAPRWPVRWTYIGLPPPPPAPARGARGEKQQQQGFAARPLPRRDWRAQFESEQAAVREELRTACPLSEPSVEAFEMTLPKELLLLGKVGGGAVDPLRLWTTFLCRGFLKSKPEHFLVQARRQPRPKKKMKRAWLPLPLESSPLRLRLSRTLLCCLFHRRAHLTSYHHPTLIRRSPATPRSAA